MGEASCQMAALLGEGSYGQDYLLANGQGYDEGWASRRADIMERAAVNAQLKNSDKVERRLKCQQEEFLGCLKEHEQDKLTLGKYVQELEAKNGELEAAKAAAEAKLEALTERADTYQLALDELREERESLMNYWKADQQKLAKLVGPDYDTMDIHSVRLMDLSAVEEMAADQNKKLAEGTPKGTSSFQKRIQARTLSLQEQLAQEKSVTFRLSHDGTLEKPAPTMPPQGEKADPNLTQCYWSPLDGCYHVLGEEEKALAAEAGATLNTAVLGQESEEVRALQRRVAELEYATTISGASVAELQKMEAATKAVNEENAQLKARAVSAERLSASAHSELEQLRAGSTGSGADPNVVSLKQQLAKVSSELHLSSEEKGRMQLQHEKEKEMFMSIAEKLSKEVEETKKALSAVFESYPHLRSVVQGASSS